MFTLHSSKGDGGYDFTINGKTIDVKSTITLSPKYRLFSEIIADYFVMYKVDVKLLNAYSIGWMTREKLLKERLHETPYATIAECEFNPNMDELLEHIQRS